MPYSRPTLTTLRDQVLQDINGAQITSGNGTLLVGLLQKALLRVMAYAEAGLSYEHYAYLDWISKQAIPWTATDEFLEGWAALKRVTRKPSIATTGTVTLTGTSFGLDVPAGTSLTRSDGALFVTTADGSVGSVLTVTVPMQATVAGAGGNFDPGTVFTLSNPIAGILAQSTASTQTDVGADQETDDALKTRMLAVYAAPPQGGDRQDYVEWALAVPGVTRAWVNPNGMGAGTVVVYTMFDLAESADGGFPQGTNGVATAETRDTAAVGDQLTVANAIYPVQPVTALVYSVSPVNSPVAFEIADLGANNTSLMQAAITEALQDMFLRLSQVGGTLNPASGGVWPVIEPSDWYAALEAIPGLTSFRVAVPDAFITPSAGNLFTAGTITFVS